MKMKLLLGKIDFSLLEKLLRKYQSKKIDSRIIIGLKLGEEAVVIEYADRYRRPKQIPLLLPQKR